MKHAFRAFLRHTAPFVAGLVAVGCMLFALFILLLTVFSLGMFEARRPDHLAIFLGSWTFIVSAFTSAFYFLRARNQIRYLFVATSTILAVLTNWLWSLPAVGDLLH